MKRIAILLLLSCSTALHAQVPKQITVAEAKALVKAALNRQQRRVPKLGVEEGDTRSGSKFWTFTVVGDSCPTCSVVVGNYDVDPKTADVFSAVMECQEETNKQLKALQKKLRAKLHLSESQYRRIKTKGPLCED